MFCTRCGQRATPGAVFCSRCGQPLPPAAEPPQGFDVPPVPPQEYAAPQQGYVAPPVPPQGNAAPQQGYAPPIPPDVPRAKKNRTGMIAGIVAGAAALIAIAAVLLFVWPGLLKPDLSVDGTWYSEARGEVIRFGPGRGFYARTPYGDFEGRYSFDTGTGEGRIRMEDGRGFDYVLDRDRLLVDNIGAFERADDDFDADGFLENAG
jgi:hypothetical protein